MKELFGSPGKKSGLILRIGQCFFAAASIGIMASASGFSTTTAFCYLIASMGLQVLWSFGLACLDMHALRFNKDLHNHIIVSLFVIGDWKLPLLELILMSQEYHSICTSNGFQCVILQYCVESHEEKCCHMRLETSGKDKSYIGLVQRTNSAFVRRGGIRLKGNSYSISCSCVLLRWCDGSLYKRHENMPNRAQILL